MPKKRCRDCGTIFYGWGLNTVCQKCGGELEPVDEETADKEINK